MYLNGSAKKSNTKGYDWWYTRVTAGLPDNCDRLQQVDEEAPTKRYRKTTRTAYKQLLWEDADC
jgi:hypothetical protein